jgi:hypothetical protein
MKLFKRRIEKLMHNIESELLKNYLMVDPLLITDSRGFLVYMRSEVNGNESVIHIDITLKKGGNVGG